MLNINAWKFTIYFDHDTTIEKTLTGHIQYTSPLSWI
jgi:hypothetical protein